MDDKTEELRDIFLDVTESETVTESQTERRGSLLRNGSVDERLVGVIDSMRDRFDFHTDLSDEELAAIVRRFYDGQTDDAIADVRSVSPETVFQARLDLHLVREADTDLDLAAVREQPSDADSEAVAAALDATPDAVERARRVAAAEHRSRRVSQRFRTEFEEILTDADVAVRLTVDAHEDGLDEATEGLEVDVEF